VNDPVAVGAAMGLFVLIALVAGLVYSVRHRRRALGLVVLCLALVALIVALYVSAGLKLPPTAAPTPPTAAPTPSAPAAAPTPIVGVPFDLPPNCSFPSPNISVAWLSAAYGAWHEVEYNYSALAKSASVAALAAPNVSQCATLTHSVAFARLVARDVNVTNGLRGELLVSNTRVCAAPGLCSGDVQLTSLLVETRLTTGPPGCAGLNVSQYALLPPGGVALVADSAQLYHFGATVANVSDVCTFLYTALATVYMPACYPYNCTLPDGAFCATNFSANASAPDGPIASYREIYGTLALSDALDCPPDFACTVLLPAGGVVAPFGT